MSAGHQIVFYSKIFLPVDKASYAYKISNQRFSALLIVKYKLKILGFWTFDKIT